MTNRPLFLLGFSSFFCLFILCSIQKINLAWFAFALFVSAALLSLFFIKKAKNKALFYIFISVLITLSGFSLLFIAQTKLIYEPIISVESSNDTNIEGVLISSAQKLDDKYYYIIKTKSIADKNIQIKLRFLSYEELNLEPLDNLRIKAKKIYPLGELDSIWHTSKKADGIYIGAYGDIVSITSPNIKTPMYYILKLQNKIKTTITKTLNTQEGAVILGLLLGDTSNINEKSYFAFRSSGVTHLFSVSGLHISLWSLFLAFALKKLRIHPKLRALISIGFLFFLIALTGFKASAIRAGIMMAVLFLSDIISKDADSLNSLGFAMLAILIVNPFAARSLSLTLSFFATFGILVYAKRFEIFFSKIVGNEKNKYIKAVNNLIITSLSISFSVILTTLPWAAYFFGSFSLISPIANIFIVLPASLAMILGGVALIFLPLKFIYYPLISLSGLIAKYTLALTNLFSKLPYAQISIEPILLIICIIASIIFAIFIFNRPKLKQKTHSYALIFFSLLLLLSNFTYALIPQNAVKIIIPDIGNNSSLIVKQGNKSAMIACGASYSKLAFTLSSNNIETLDFLAIPRLNKTESLAYDQVIHRYKPENILCANELYADIHKYEDSNINFANSCDTNIFNEITLEYENRDNLSAIKLYINQISLIICFLPISDFNSLPLSWQEADILICRADLPKSINPHNFKHIILSTNKDIMHKPNLDIKTTKTLGEIHIKINPKGDIKFL